MEDSQKLLDSMDKLRVSAGSSSSNFKKKPIIIIVVGMAGKIISLMFFKIHYVCKFWFFCERDFNSLMLAGSGKTSFLHRLVCQTFESNSRGYVVNLDPAVMSLPFGANIDIRDTVKYKEVMKQYNLGPNGGILTSLNLFATKFDEVNMPPESVQSIVALLFLLCLIVLSLFAIWFRLSL